MKDIKIILTLSLVILVAASASSVFAKPKDKEIRQEFNKEIAKGMDNGLLDFISRKVELTPASTSTSASTDTSSTTTAATTTPTATSTTPVATTTSTITPTTTEATTTAATTTPVVSSVKPTTTNTSNAFSSFMGSMFSSGHSNTYYQSTSFSANTTSALKLFALASAVGGLVLLGARAIPRRASLKLKH